MCLIFTVYIFLGPYLLDASQFSTTVYADPIVAEVSWGILDSVANYSLNLSLQYTLIKVNSPECLLQNNLPTVR